MARVTAFAVLLLTLLGGFSSRASADGTAREENEYRLLALGYSPHEVADIVSGRISQKALDTAALMIAVGRGREEAANYLDSQYMLATAARNAGNARNAPPPEIEIPFASFTAFDILIDRYANLHRVDAAIVRAIIGAESMFNHAARSTAGAIGLMQLMPATARALGVDPFVPEQNIEGGVRYFAEQLKAFGGVELALVAYNAGPGFAQRYANGRTALYGETREYVRRVMARLR